MSSREYLLPAMESCQRVTVYLQPTMVGWLTEEAKERAKDNPNFKKKGRKMIGPMIRQIVLEYFVNKEEA